MTVGRNDPAFRIELGLFLREGDRHAACQRHVALVVQQVLAGQTDRDQRGGAGGLDVQARAAQVHFVGNPRGQIVLVAGQHRLEPADEAEEIAIGQQIGEQIGVHARTGEHADQTVVGVGIAAGAFERLPGAFQKDPVLWVHDFRLLRIDVEERGVEPVGILQDGPGLHQIRVVDRRRTVEQGPLQFLVVEERNRLHAVAEIAPELLRVLRVRKTAGQAGDGNVFALCFRMAHTFTLAPNCLPRVAAALCFCVRSWIFCAKGSFCFSSLRQPASDRIVGYSNSLMTGRSAPSLSRSLFWTCTT